MGIEIEKPFFLFAFIELNNRQLRFKDISKINNLKSWKVVFEELDNIYFIEISKNIIIKLD